jgi:ribonuclease BN (tRNA processing enzyme)
VNNRFTVIGCGTVVPEAATGGSSFLLETPSTLALLDCGPGTVRTLATLGVEWSAITDIVLTHFHADHVGGIPGLLFALTYGLLPETRERPLRVWGPDGTRSMFAYLAAGLGGFMENPGFPLEIVEVRPDRAQSITEGIELHALSTPHTAESLAYRVEGKGVSMVYSGDTGARVDLGGFAEGCGLFVCECSLPDDLVGDNHLSPSGVAAFAAEASPDLLLLTHVYPQFRAAADVPGLVGRAGFGGRVELASEGWSTSLPIG